VRPADNPFRRQRVEAEVRYFMAAADRQALLQDWAAHGCRGAIVGPHGSGKTTLLEDLLPDLRAAGWQALPLQLRNESARPPADWRRRWQATPRPRLLLLDGAEQLGRWGWLRLRRQALPADGLLISSHRPGRLPTIWRCEVDAALLRRIIGELLPEPPPLDYDALLRRHHGNVRDCLRELYLACV